MARITRKTQKVFGSTAGATGITTYGSPAAGSPVYSTDVATIQTAAWDTGWSAAALAGTEIPTFQDFNAIHYVNTTQLAYLFQEGIPEYDSTTTYYTNSVVKKAGTYEIYGSVINNNTGNALPSAVTNANWAYLGDLSNLANGGNVTGQASSVDSEIALFSGTTGKAIKRATGTGYVKVSSGVMGTPAATIPLTDLAVQAASTVLMNATSGSAAPTAVALSASQLLGRGSTGNGGAITLGTGLSMSGTTLNAASPSVFTSSAQTVAANTTVTVAHGLGAEPTIIQLIIQCTSADISYSIGDRVVLGTATDSVANRGIGALIDTTNVTVLFATGGILIPNKTTRVPANIDTTKWQLYVRAIRIT